MYVGTSTMGWSLKPKIRGAVQINFTQRTPYPLVHVYTCSYIDTAPFPHLPKALYLQLVECKNLLHFFSCYICIYMYMYIIGEHNLTFALTYIVCSTCTCTLYMYRYTCAT